MKLYNFTNEKYAKQNIELKRLKISRLSSLNDPFEFLGPSQANEQVRRVIANVKRRSDENHGLVCMSKSWRSPLMWGHYADNHKGICLGFEVTDKKFEAVKYINSRDEVMASNLLKAIKIGKTDFPIDFTKNLYSSKFSAWKYEREYRKLILLRDALFEKDSGNYFFEFSEDFKLSEVIIGCNSGLTKEDVYGLVKEFNSDIKIFKVRPAFKTFEMVMNRNFGQLMHKKSAEEADND